MGEGEQGRVWGDKEGGTNKEQTRKHEAKRSTTEENRKKKKKRPKRGTPSPPKTGRKIEFFI